MSKLIKNKFRKLFFLLLFFICKIQLIHGIFFTGRGKSDVHNFFKQVGQIGLHNFLEGQVIGNPHIYSEYDFIIIGSGPAGCVLANRLSENPKHTILLIEAGGTENFFHQIPSMPAYFQSTASNWGYQSEPQKNACFGMPENRCQLPRGKVLGGSSSINYMIYNRGNRHDFDRWAAAGNPGWSYADVLPYFKKSERSLLYTKGVEKYGYHNHTGNLNVEYAPYRTKTVDTFIKAGIEVGHKEIDYNGDSQVGTSYVQTTTHKGQRASAAKTFINPIRNRKNLHIITSTRVTKVLIDSQTKTATGVEIINNRKRLAVKARKEIILSAGAFNSPQLLMLSGVGPADNLKAVGIPLIKELPVGKTLYDHMSHFGPTFIMNTTGNTLRTNEITSEYIAQYTEGRGPLTLIGGVEALTFLKIPNSKEPADVPDIELILVAGSFASDEGTGLLRGANLKKNIYKKVWKPLEFQPEDHCSVLVMDFHPKSKGRLWLHNRNPFEWPRIDPRYFSNKNDIENILQGIKAAIKIFQAPSFKNIGARILDTPVPGCEHLHFGSDDYWRCSIKTLSYTIHHQVGTCKMGPESDPTTVVNHELKVHGIKKLRVADTSIIPLPPTSHTNAVSFMIGEKAADMIKAAWK